MNNIFDKIKRENKLLTIVGDFNYNLLNHEVDTQVDEFIHTMLSNFCQPQIIQPTRFVDNAKPSLLDNIFLNSVEYETQSENITSEISGHMPKFTLEKHDLRITKATKIQKRGFRKFNQQKFIVDMKHLDLLRILKHHTKCEPKL